MRVAIVLFLAGCGFAPISAHATSDSGGDDQPVDAAIDGPPDAAVPITCGDVTCDPHATCNAAGSNATCSCSAGYTGNGFTCTDVDECAAMNGGCSAACENTSGSFTCYVPQTCADLASHGVAVNNSSHTLYLGGLASQPWTVYCAGAGASAKEYLALTGTNTSIYEHGGDSPGTDVKTAFTKIRFMVATKLIDISDRTFATSTGMVNHSNNGTMVTSMAYGIAMNCKQAGDNSTTASFDISATHFAFDTNSTFSTGGSQASGSVGLSSQNQKLAVHGGGFCGWEAPTGTPMNPFNANVDSSNGQLLALVYH
ncbi:MAG: EGF domain-containing protein [Deltaproteobacteria bacterium]